MDCLFITTNGMKLSYVLWLALSLVISAKKNINIYNNHPRKSSHKYLNANHVTLHDTSLVGMHNSFIHEKFIVKPCLKVICTRNCAISILYITVDNSSNDKTSPELWKDIQKIFLPRNTESSLLLWQLSKVIINTSDTKTSIANTSIIN